MSKYKVTQTVLREAKPLVAALQAVGYTKDQIEVHDEPQPLYGYRGDKRAEKAHVIIRRQHVGSASNDVGFVLGEKAKAIISDFDSHTHFTNKKLKAVVQHYSKAIILEESKSSLFEFEMDGDDMIVKVPVNA